VASTTESTSVLEGIDPGWTTVNQLLTPELAPTGHHFFVVDS
jgi:hypothetical protein